MGNTCSRLNLSTYQQDHPHIHGEYRTGADLSPLAGGSPPHTWGIPNLWISINQYVRITPTYMGNTDLINAERVFGEDHPHIHGEYLSERGYSLLVKGSPPHTWGIQR